MPPRIRFYTDGHPSVSEGLAVQIAPGRLFIDPSVTDTLEDACRQILGRNATTNFGPRFACRQRTNFCLR